MKVLLDECVPRKLKNHLAGHVCRTVPEVGLAVKKNGELLLVAQEAGFDVFITVDRGMEYEQNLGRQNIAVVSLRAKSSRLADLVALMPEVLRLLPFIKSGELIRVGS